MKKIGICLLCIVLLTLGACSKKKDYKRDTRPGEYVELSFKEMKDKIENGDTFIALISQTSCTHCQEYKQDVLKPYLENHHLEIYEVNITNEKDPQQCFTDIQNYIKKLTDDDSKQFMGTPYTFIAEDKEIAEGHSGSMEKDQLDEFVMKFQLDAKK